MPDVDLLCLFGTETGFFPLMSGPRDLLARFYTGNGTRLQMTGPQLRARPLTANGVRPRLSVGLVRMRVIEGTGQRARIVIPLSALTPVMQQLLPRGIAWTRDSDAELTQFLDGLSLEFCRVEKRITDLLREADPALADELLPEWEALLELEGQGNAAVVAKLAARGRQDGPFFEELALTLGYTATVEEVRPFRAGQARAGDRITNGRWTFAWYVVTTSGADDALLEKTISAAAPDHTKVHFRYE